MSESILFRGAHIRYFDVRHEEGGALTRLHLTADFSTPVIERMEWADPGHSVTTANLEGALCATHFVMTPGDKALRTHEIQFDINEAADFKLCTVKDGEDSKHRELRFIVRTSAAGVAAKLDEYIRRVGDHQGALRIAYVKQEELELEAGSEGPSTGKDTRQQKIDKALASDEDSDGHCTSCNVGIPMRGDGTDYHDNGDICRATAGNSTLASAREVNGGTHARLAKQGAH